MLRIGRMSRSAKMNATTPPKLIPPFQSTAASGTLPIEQTKDSIATIGPTIGPHSAESTGWPVRKKLRQKDSGTQAPIAPAISRPVIRSRRMAPLGLLVRLVDQALAHDDAEEHG